MEFLKSPIENEPEMLRLLGLITARWAAAEHQMALLLGQVLGDDDSAIQVYYALGAFRSRQQLVLTLVRSAEISNLQLSKFTEFHKRASERTLEKLGKLWNTRNDYMHSPYVSGEKKGDISLRKIRPTAPAASGDFRVHTNELTTHANRVYQMTLRLYAINNRNGLRQIHDAKGGLNWMRYGYRRDEQ
ncbi:hypothetical protein [uncultured Roseibium sp.]|uniref:hypothetical protein n=1 Tax=uncultured Roseibium sp. TaxID=1936171 RepID=UPI0032174628